MPDIAAQLKKIDEKFTEFKAEHKKELDAKADGKDATVLATRADEASAAITDLQTELKDMMEMQKKIEALEVLLARSTGPGAGEGGEKALMAEKLGAAELVSMRHKITMEQVLAGKGPEVNLEEYRAYKAAFSKLLRAPGTMTQDDKMAMQVGADPQGGYMVPPDVSGAMVELIYQTSPMRQIASVTSTSVDTFKGPRDLDDLDAGWVGEQDSRPETDTPDLGEYEIAIDEQYALPKMTQKLLDDAQFPVESWLTGKVSRKFARQENTAFVLGNGVKKPRGFLTYPHGIPTAAAFDVIEQIPSGGAGAFAATDPGDVFITASFKLKAPLRPGSVWVMNSQTESATRKLKDGQDNYLWQPNFGAMTGGALVGFPVVNFEDMPDIAANTLSVGFGNFKEGYQIVDRMGVRLLKDPYTQKGYMVFYMTKRVGGDVMNFEALKLIKFATSV